MDCEYWKDIVARLRTESNWASHVLCTCIDEEGSNLSQALECVAAKTIIENVIFAYGDWSVQPYCDQILYKFDKEQIISVFEQIEKPTKNMEKGVSFVLE